MSPRGTSPNVLPLDPLTVPLHGTALIEASAGTGKTHTITTLYVRLLLESELAVDQILVVTYTNAATAELRGRIRRRLHETLLALDNAEAGDASLEAFVTGRRDSGKLEMDRLRLLNALHGFDQAAIFTIHGFCQRMLQEHAFESGVAFDTDLVADQRPLIDQVVRDFWVRELHDAPHDFVTFVSASKTKALEHLQRLATLATTHPEMPILPEPTAGSADEPEARWLAMQLACVEYVRRELRRRKQEARQQSFDDLLQRLVDGLRAENGPRLAERIRERLRAALIDEFQDTDPLQYEIFRRVYHGATGTALFLIGDPKQAIYAFRGADVFAYLAAKQDAQVECTLLTNWRSGPSLTAAVNALFTQARAPFVFDDIPFRPVDAAPNAADQLGGSAAGQAPLQIVFVPRGTGGVKPGAHGAILKNVPLSRYIAADIVRLLRSGATLAGRPLVAGDVAVLCRMNRQAVETQQELRALNLPSVLHGDASVFDSAESEEVGRVLRGIAEPGDASAVRAALATTLLGQSAADLFALQTDERRWDDWLQRFQEWHQLWERRGFVAAFRAMIDTQEVVPQLLGLNDGERRLTNVLHLMELLHAASVDERYGPTALVHWLSQMRSDEEARAGLGSEAAQIRLESDEAAIKLVTIHKSKGLQYPLVYCPYLWDGGSLHPSDKRAPRFHDAEDHNRLKLDLGSPESASHLEIAKRETLAESLRLLYVALTRAQHCCTLVWGAFSGCETSALGYILHPDRVAADPADGAARRIKGFVSSRRDEGMRADLEALVALAGGAIAVRDLVLQPSPPWVSDDQSEHPLSCRNTARMLALRWRTASFSSLIRGSAMLSRPAEEGVDYDAAAPLPVVPAPAPTGEALVVLHDFPAGTRPGQVLHGILERLDFRQTDRVGLQNQVAVALDHGGIDGRWTGNVVAALDNVLDTRLDGHGLRLRDVAMEKRLNELEFIFPVALHDGVQRKADEQLGLWPSVQRATPFTPKRLAQIFARHARLPLAPEYANRLALLDFTALSGFLRGFIDLIFEHDGRWYVVDYKSNRLGTSPQAYAPQRLAPVMMSHHYVLQYHLYAVALHRYLRQRLAGYDYERHYGGAYYLFVRGMAPTYARGNGIFFDRPARRLVELLSEALDGDGERT